MPLTPDFIAIVRKLAAEQGPGAFLDVRRCKSLLADYAAGECKKERRRLELVLEGGYQKIIADADDVAAAKAAVARRLRDDDGLSDEAAAEMAGLLALALRGDAKAKPDVVCAKCGKPLEQEWKACPFCGAVVGRVAAPAQTPPRQQASRQPPSPAAADGGVEDLAETWPGLAQLSFDERMSYYRQVYTA